MVNIIILPAPNGPIKVRFPFKIIKPKTESTKPLTIIKQCQHFIKIAKVQPVINKALKKHLNKAFIHLSQPALNPTLRIKPNDR